jgi:3-deoxy-D-manno-octulosonate 8-phosphate phosphatase (KDO 8-P phosphatase)
MTALPYLAVFSDVDGVLTRGHLYIGPDGKEVFKRFHVRDGLGIKCLQKKGILFGVISGRDSLPLRERMQELGVSEVHLGKDEKLDVLKQILTAHSISPSRVAYLGDDLNDLSIFDYLREEGGHTVCPADAAKLVCAQAHQILKARGGEGALREFSDQILGMNDKVPS